MKVKLGIYKWKLRVKDGNPKLAQLIFKKISLP